MTCPVTRVHQVVIPENVYCSTQYEYIKFTYARSSLESIDWQKKYKMSNITEGEQGLVSYGCGSSADPCMQVCQNIRLCNLAYRISYVDLRPPYNVLPAQRYASTASQGR